MQQRYAIQICNTDMQQRYAITICNTDMQYRFATKICNKDMQHMQYIPETVLALIGFLLVVKAVPSRPPPAVATTWARRCKKAFSLQVSH